MASLADFSARERAYLLEGFDCTCHPGGALCFLDDPLKKRILLDRLAILSSLRSPVVTLASRFRGSERERAAEIQKFVQHAVAYREEAEDVFCEAWFTLTRGYGDCDDSSVVVAALCWANGIEARIVIVRLPTTLHACAQAVVGGRWVWLEASVYCDLGDDPRRIARANQRKTKSSLPCGDPPRTDRFDAG